MEKSDDLPKRSPMELIKALRERAFYLLGQSWEVPATVAMMRGAADCIERLSAPVVSPSQDEVIVDAYQKAKELWSLQCFCFMSAPETVRRAAHEVARDGFNELAGILGPLARPVLDAEYRAAEAEAKKASAVVTQEGE